MVRPAHAASGNEDATVVEVAARVAGTQLGPTLRLVRLLGSGGMGEVWLGEHVEHGAVAVKLVDVAATPGYRERLVREARLTARVKHPNAVRLLDHGAAADGTPYLVLELIDGESLATRIGASGGLPLDEVRGIVGDVAAVLDAAHAVHVLHRDVKPSNVMLPRGAGVRAKVVDFGIARATDGSETSQLTSPGVLVGTLAYMSPEQLIEGRPADRHADLWGLAVLAYESLAGKPPFRGGTRAAVCAAMVLKRYERITKIAPSLPAALDAWFERAFATDATQRFVSAAELAESFDAAASGHVGSMAPRAPEVVALPTPERLFGREREIASVLRAFEQASKGRSRVLFVRGYSGTGKSSLVASVERTLVDAGATYVAGKFDQFNRGTPYDSLIQALRVLIQKKLREPDSVRDARASALAGQSARALMEVIPELEDLLGPQPPLDPVSPEEARNRFQLAVERLVSSLATAAHPLVLFFDDLQWADLASIDLITNLATDPESRHVLFIGAYRDNEVDAAHPLTSALERLGGSRAVEHVEVGPLSEDAVLDLLSAIFPGSTGRARFASVCYAKTHGNAFFLRRLLEALAEEGPLRYDHDARQWTWELPAIEARPITGDVVDFVAAEIRRMPPASGRAIGAASCIGDVFDLDVLAVALGQDRGRAIESLRSSLSRELVVPADAPVVVASEARDAFRVTFRFAHDRIRQAARRLVSDADAATFHHAVARFLLARLDPAERERRLFEIVDHLNAGLGAHASPDDARLLRTLNLSAARRATASAAFEAAYRYTQRALAHVPPDAWTTEYPETLAMHVEGARAAYLGGDHATMRALVKIAAEHARSPLDRVAAREVELHARVAQQELVEAVQLSLALLSDLGLALPTAPTRADVEEAVGATVAQLAGVTADDLAKIPMALDPKVVAMLRIQNDTMSSAYLAAPNLLPIMGCNIVRMTLENGVCKESPYGFAILALVLSAGMAIDLADRVGKLALDLLGRVDDRSVAPRTTHVVTSFVRPWVEPVRGAVDDGRGVFRIGMDTGDFEYAAWGLHTMTRDGFFGGVALDELESMYERTFAILEHHKQVAAMGVNAPFGQAIANLRGRAPDPRRLTGPGYDEAVQRELFRKIHYRGASFVLGVIAAYMRFLFRDLDATLACLEDAAPYADGAVATYNQVWFHQLRALATLGRERPGSPGAEAALADVAPDIALLRTWQRFSPANHDHRVHLVEAERARVAGSEAADLLYDQAIRRAEQNRFLHEAALANELAYRHHDAKGNDLLAAAYFAEAVAAWGRWGATAKAAELARESAG